LQGYSFYKAHSASYAVESYQSLYLKCITRRVYGGSYQQPRRILGTEVYVHEAKMSGGIITLCQQSECETTVYGVDVPTLWVLKGSIKTAHRIVADRTNGEYQSLENFINRIPIGIEGIKS
jgi:DNA polymerase-3 subunit alpha/error-prone DNA polymerase